MSRLRRILLVGKDARTDAIASACLTGAEPVDLFGFAEMRLPGLATKCKLLFEGSLTSTSRLREIVEEIQPDLAIIGPEEPLESGFVDQLEALGVPAFGPTKDLARVESSKSWTRALLERHQIPGNPAYAVFTDVDPLERYMESLGSFVIKPDGLTAGKGVRVFGEHLKTIEQALAYAAELIKADGKVQVEERLLGEEFSLQTITDGQAVLHCPVVQDHKRADEGDTGPNTGGMGSYSCPDLSLPFLDDADVARARSINERVIDALAVETGRPYRGVLYGGFMATQNGVGLIEYNARFGDPEAMNVLPLFRGDFVELCASVAGGTFDPDRYAFASKATVCKYLVPEDYPGAPATGQRLVIPDDLQNRDDLKWFWAACRQEGQDIYLTSSRSGAFVGMGDSLEVAERIAEDAARQVKDHNPIRYRRDIGSASLVEARVKHMNALRTSAVAA